MKVALDIDGVVSNTPRIIQSVLDERKIEAEFTQYHPTIKGVEDTNSFMNEIVTDIFANRMHEIEPYQDALYSIGNIDKFVGPITFVTSRREEFGDNTNKWIRNHFPSLSFSLVHRRSEEKTQFLLDEGFRLFVEDRLRTVNQASEAGIRTFLFNRGWNLNRYTHEKVVRISSLNTFFSLAVSKYIKEENHMAQNMYCSDHKTSSKKYRDGYDKIDWGNSKKNENTINTTNVQK